MIRIGMGQIEVIPGNPRKNKETILQAIAYAKALRLDLLILPELALSGYLIGDVWDQPAFVNECVTMGEDIIKATQNIAVIFGNVGVDTTKHNADGRVRKYNAIFAAQNGKVIAPQESPYPFVIKTLDPNYRFFNEARYFTNLTTVAYELHRPVEELLGLLPFSFKGEPFTVAPLLCEDSWDENYLISPTTTLQEKSQLLETPIDAYINISASPFTLGKNERRHRLFQTRAKELNAPIFYINSIGLQNNGKSLCTFDGQSTVYTAEGQIGVQLPAYESTIQPVLLEKLATTYEPVNLLEGQPVKRELPPLPAPNEIEQIYNTLHYGIRSFLKQTGIKKIVIGVSGGIDSALNAALYATILDPSQIYLVNMPSRFNSHATKDLAAQLAHNLGCHYAVCPVEDSLQLTTNQLSELSFSRPTGETESLTLSSFVKENIQARDRSSRILAGIAAAVGGAFTCNGNKTEFTIGYATLYGDLAGFLAATGDLWKYQVYGLAQYLNTVIFKRQVIPQGTIDIIPSAELSENQDITKGQGDPLQYEYHDRLFRAFIEPWNRLSPEDILLAYKEKRLVSLLDLPQPIEQYFKSAHDFIADLERWWNLFSGMAVAKRIQSPPVIVVSRRAYGGDLQESQMKPYYTDAYYSLKAELL
ncbi:NAD(+) synthase [Veillonella sp. R32]|uniref:NAD(+) synthase n=1 Tax=Veillonella sp. R32 TaxID=2021312 RepID=UPI001389B557|nr:NAD(+) synthase [Veillonella sp. R32]KAF1682029.1 NAD(+) synthase [Veillonella sp. R32]